MHILLVEDNSALAEIFRFNLQAEGFHVTVAHNGFQALECAEAVTVDLVLTDYGMPGMTGAEFCRIIRRDSRYAETPIMLMTAYSRDLDFPRLREELNLAHLWSKPLSPSELVASIKTLLLSNAGSG